VIFSPVLVLDIHKHDVNSQIFGLVEPNFLLFELASSTLKFWDSFHLKINFDVTF
jgi:hypothetical protein